MFHDIWSFWTPPWLKGSTFMCRFYLLVTKSPSFWPHPQFYSCMSPCMKWTCFTSRISWSLPLRILHRCLWRFSFLCVLVVMPRAAGRLTEVLSGHSWDFYQTLGPYFSHIWKLHFHFIPPLFPNHRKVIWQLWGRADSSGRGTKAEAPPNTLCCTNLWTPDVN